jgi:hypothetical protein
VKVITHVHPLPLTAMRGTLPSLLITTSCRSQGHLDIQVLLFTKVFAVNEGFHIVDLKCLVRGVLYCVCLFYSFLCKFAHGLLTRYGLVPVLCILCSVLFCDTAVLCVTVFLLCIVLFIVPVWYCVGL